jgi:hypothetical protein
MNEQLYRFFLYTRSRPHRAYRVQYLGYGPGLARMQPHAAPSADESTELNDNNTRGINDANGSSNYPVD